MALKENGLAQDLWYRWLDWPPVTRFDRFLSWLYRREK